MAEIRFGNPCMVKALRNTAHAGVQYSKSMVLLAVFLLTSEAYAQNKLSLPEPEVRSDILVEEKTKHRTYGQLRIEGMKYFTELPGSPQLTYSQFLSGQLSYIGEGVWFENAADVSAGTFFSQNQSHMVVHELYTSPRTADFRVYVGRKKNNWSEMDHEWNMGVWQPYFELDALRPEEQGLTGVFLDVNRQNWQITAFASPMFVPSLGPNVREEDGGLVADNRWYQAPARQADLISGKPTPITYKLSIPEAAKLAAQPGYAMMGRLGNKDNGFWLTSSVGYTPVNQLLLKRNVKYQMPQDDVGVIVSPDVTYHTVVAADLGYTQGNARAVLSYMQDDPKYKQADPDWAIQKLSGIRSYSLGMDWTVQNFLSRSLLLQTAYLHVDGGEIRDVGSDGSPDAINLYDQRLKFTEAWRVRVQGELMRLFRRPLVTKFSYLYDQNQKGSMVNTEFLYYPSQAWALVVGADFLGVEDETFNPTSFLNRYRANDRVYGGMTYVF